MAWTAPPTFTAGNALTAAQLNILGSDLNETAPAKASSSGGQYFVATGVNAIAARLQVNTGVTTSETTTSTAFTDLATVGPAVTFTSGTLFMVLMNSSLSNNTSGQTSSIGFAISGATTTPAGEIYISLTSSAVGQQATMGGVRMVHGATAGSNTVTLKYSVGGGTGTFQRRSLIVLPF
jgi:hypothetical protein